MFDGTLSTIYLDSHVMAQTVYCLSELFAVVRIRRLYVSHAFAAFGIGPNIVRTLAAK